MNPKFYQSHGHCVNSSVTLGPELSTLWKRLVCQKRGVQKMSFLLTVLQISMVYTSGWFEVMSWSWTKILKKNSEEQSDRLSYLLLDLCLVKLFLVFPNGLWSWARFIFPTLGENFSIILSYLLFFPPHWHVMLVSLCFTTRKVIV